MQIALPVPQVVELFGCEPTEEQFQVLVLAAGLSDRPVSASGGGRLGWPEGSLEVRELGDAFESVAVYGADGSLLAFAVS